MNEQMKVQVQDIPQEIRGWNWGAFFLNWIWGIGNNVWIALLMFIPCVGFVMPFVLGAKGNAWAWKNKKWESVEHFKNVQRIWSIVGVTLFFAMIAFSIVLVFVINMTMKSSDVYKDALSKVQTNPQAIEILGEPIEDGLFLSGNISVENANGTANISFPVSGPKGKGKVYVEATKSMGKWNFTGLTLVPKGSDKQISIAP